MALKLNAWWGPAYRHAGPWRRGGSAHSIRRPELVDELGRGVDVAEAEHRKRVPFGIIDRLGGIRLVQARRLDAESLTFFPQSGTDPSKKAA